MFICSLAQPTPYVGLALSHLVLALAHQGVVPFAPMVTRDFWYPYMVTFDTNFPLPIDAVNRVLSFFDREDSAQSQPYQQAWARQMPRDGWRILSVKIRWNLQAISGADS